MSHFTVLVIGDNHEAALAPFQENNMGDCPREYMEFRDDEDEYRAEYESESRSMKRLPDGRLVSPYAKEFKTRGSEYGFGSDDVYTFPDGTQDVEVPFKELYPTMEAFAADWHGSKERDPEKGRYGYWDNPNKKWDWYQVGGRWSGMLKLKPGARGLSGEPGLMGSRFAEGADRADQAHKRDIDFDGMRNEAEAKARESWNHCRTIIAGLDLWHSWEHVREVICKGDLDAAREFYRNQPAIVKLREADRDRYGWDTDDKLTWSLDNYIQLARDKAGVTFALLHDGKWYERGEMGWWACVSNEKPDGEWEREFAKLLDALPDDALLTVVDCHI